MWIATSVLVTEAETGTETPAADKITGGASPEQDVILKMVIRISRPPRRRSREPSADARRAVALIDGGDHVINVIAGGVASGGDTDRKRRRHLRSIEKA